MRHVSFSDDWPPQSKEHAECQSPSDIRILGNLDVIFDKMDFKYNELCDVPGFGFEVSPVLNKERCLDCANVLGFFPGSWLAAAFIGLFENGMALICNVEIFFTPDDIKAFFFFDFIVLYV